MSNSVLNSARWIASNAQDVVIDEFGLERVAKSLKSLKSYDRKSWSAHPLHPQTQDRNAVDTIFFMDLLNFCFWSPYTVKFKGTAYTGYWSLCACVKRAAVNGIPLTSPSFYAHASTEQLRDAFASDNETDMPMLQTRMDLLHRAGSILLEKCNGSFTTVIESANGSAQGFIQKVIELFGDMFDDSLVYQGERVTFNKRVQILVADIWACFDGKGYGRFVDIDSITMFADYRVPQTLVHLGILKYSDRLLTKLVTRIPEADLEECLLPRGHSFEVEIRGCSIWAVELLLQKIKALNPTSTFNAILLDFYLWDLAKSNSVEMAHIPIHLTRSIYY